MMKVVLKRIGWDNLAPRLADNKPTLMCKAVHADASKYPKEKLRTVSSTTQEITNPRGRGVLPKILGGGVPPYFRPKYMIFHTPFQT